MLVAGPSLIFIGELARALFFLLILNVLVSTFVKSKIESKFALYLLLLAEFYAVTAMDLFVLFERRMKYSPFLFPQLIK